MPSPFEPLPQEPGSSTKRDLFETYLGRDLRPLLEDVASRPKHYSQGELELVERLRTGRPTNATERSALLLQFMRRTEPRKVERETRKRITQSIVTPPTPPPAFEDQKLFTGAIRLI